MNNLVCKGVHMKMNLSLELRVSVDVGSEL
jgi:hypothetical protein